MLTNCWLITHCLWFNGMAKSFVTEEYRVWFQFLLPKYFHGCSVPGMIEDTLIWISCVNISFHNFMVLTQVISPVLRTTFTNMQFKSSSISQLIRQLHLVHVDTYLNYRPLASIWMHILVLLSLYFLKSKSVFHYQQYL